MCPEQLKSRTLALQAKVDGHLARDRLWPFKLKNQRKGKLFVDASVGSMRALPATPSSTRQEAIWHIGLIDEYACHT
jgi:hypothetical protein